MKGIKDKIGAITQIQPPQIRKDIQKLRGQIATLNQFIAKLAECSLPFFTILRAPQEWIRGQNSTKLSKISSAILNTYQHCRD
jgi:hypothetical protein